MTPEEEIQDLKNQLATAKEKAAELASEQGRVHDVLLTIDEVPHYDDKGVRGIDEQVKDLAGLYRQLQKNCLQAFDLKTEVESDLAKANAAVEAKDRLIADQNKLAAERQEWALHTNEIIRGLKAQLAAQQSVPPEARAVERDRQGPTLTAAHYKTAKKIMEMVVAAYLEDPEEIQNSGVGQAIALEIEEHEHQAIQRTCFPQGEGVEWSKALKHARMAMLALESCTIEGISRLRKIPNHISVENHLRNQCSAARVALDGVIETLESVPSRPTAAREDGASLIAAERKRQVEKEEWTECHDDTHTEGDLRDAAEAYLRELRYRPARDGEPRCGPSAPWPWSQDAWKPTADPVRQLVKAGALIAAEVDRLKRAAIDAAMQQGGKTP